MGNVPEMRSRPPKAAAKTAGSGGQDCNTQLYCIIPSWFIKSFGWYEDRDSIFIQVSIYVASPLIGNDDYGILYYQALIDRYQSQPPGCQP